MSALSQCPGCSRHVKVTEAACPFCGIAVSLVAPEVTSSGRRLGRAALLAIGAATAIACETPKAEPNGPAAAVYGGPPIEARDAGNAVPGPVPSASVDTDRTIYGGPPVASETAPVPKPSATQPPRTIYGGPPTKK